jgi:uncharacterized membrane-anchored protein YitT (DUF2179 family)
MNTNRFRDYKDYGLIILGTLLQAVALRLFLVPSHLVSGGVSGIAQVINYYSGWPIGAMVVVGNIPLFVLGWRFLGGPRFALRTVVAVLTYSFFADILILVLPEKGLTGDLLLNALYGGIMCGIGYGLVYRGRGTSGGSDILARILNHWKGVPLSQSYLLVDALIILIAGLSFSWENALYALVLLYVSGIAAEGVVEGTNLVRTVMIITNKPQEVANQILSLMGRGVTCLPGVGAYTGPCCIVSSIVQRFPK